MLRGVFINRPVVAFTPRALKFGNQGIDTTSPEHNVALTDVGAAPLAITSIAASGDFAQSNDCGSSLSIGKACTVNATFAPTPDGVRTGTLSFTDNASVVPQVLALSGPAQGQASRSVLPAAHPLRGPSLRVKWQVTRWSSRP
jgi:hypothetical protein